MLGRGCGRQTFLWQSEDSGWRAGEGLCGEKGSLLAPRNLHSWHIQLHWALQSLGIFFRLPLTPSSLELDFQGLISFHFLQRSGDFFSKLPSFTAIRVIILPPPFLMATPSPSAGRAWPQLSPKAPCFLQERSQESRTGVALILQEPFSHREDVLAELSEVWGVQEAQIETDAGSLLQALKSLTSPACNEGQELCVCV